MYCDVSNKLHFCNLPSAVSNGGKPGQYLLLLVSLFIFAEECCIVQGGVWGGDKGRFVSVSVTTGGSNCCLTEQPLGESFLRCLMVPMSTLEVHVVLQEKTDRSWLTGLLIPESSSAIQYNTVDVLGITIVASYCCVHKVK